MKRILPFAVLLFALIPCVYWNLSDASSIEEEEKYPKQFMLQEMYKQWKEMLQNPEGQIPMDKAFASWQYAGEMMKRQSSGLNAFSTNGINWVSRGPSNVGGRTRSLMVSPNDTTGNTVFVGSVGGGLWKSTNMRGASPTWSPVNDFMENLALSTLAYDPVNKLIFYAGTGEGFNSADAARGNGIMKSTDGGSTWSFLSSTQNSSFYYVNKIIVAANDTVVAVTNSGIYRSTNGGSTWSQRVSGYFGDLEKAANGKLYAATKNGGGGVYISSDKGLTWTQASTGLPTGLSSYSRYELATAPSDSSRIYVMAYSDAGGTTRFYKSTDGGLNYSQIATPVDSDGGISSLDLTRGQGWYDLIIKVDPNNADVVYTGGIDIFKTTNGGTSWSQITHWYGGYGFQNVHADQHFIEFEGTNSNVIYFTNDGGVFQTTNGTAATPTIVARNTNYNVTQFYACAMHPTSGSNFFLAGAQDNGTQKFTAAGLGATSSASGGDGAFCNIDQLNPTYMFSQYVYNNYYRSTNGGSSFSGVSNAYSNTGRFINPTRYDDNTKDLYAATSSGKFLRWNSANTGTTFDVVTVTAMGTQTVSSITVSATTADMVYFGTGSGQIIEVSSASTVTGTVAGRSLGTPSGGYLNCIWQDPSNAAHMMVVYSNFGINNIYETSNATASTPTWTVRDGNLPDMPVFWILPEPGNTSNSVLIATEYGVWSTDNFSNASPTWTINSNGLSRCRVTQLYFRASDNTLVASTYGRGLFTATYIPGSSCGTPAGLTSGNVTLNSATVSWDSVTEATNYDVEYKLSTTTTWSTGVAATTSNSTSLSGLQQASLYDWRVRTNCSAGSSSYASGQFTTTSACGIPTSLSSGSITTTGATISWAAVANALDYNVEYKVSTSSTWLTVVTGASSLSYTFSGNLSPSTTYNWRVFARCAEGLGEPGAASFTTATLPVCNDTYESNNTFTAAKTISQGTTIHAGITSSTDQDYFKFSTPNNSNTNVKVTLSNLPADYDIYLYNSKQVLLSSATTSGTGTEVVIYNTTVKRASYIIRVIGKGGVFSTSQCYNLLPQVSSIIWAGTELGMGVNRNEAQAGVSIYPNPATQQVFIDLNSDGGFEAQISLVNMSGQKVKQLSTLIMTGSNHLPVSVSGLRAGTYLLRIQGNGNNYMQKITIQ